MKLANIFGKKQYLKFPKNTINFVPRQTLSVKINDIVYYISLICDNNFAVQVVLLDDNNNVISKLLELNEDTASIVKLNNTLYVITSNTAYIYDINNLDAMPTKIFLGNINIQGVCANANYIYVFSIARNSIIKYDDKLQELQEYANPYSKYGHLSLELACSEERIFSIPIMPPSEEEYIQMKNFIAQLTNPEIAKLNDRVNSCSYNKDENTLYIAMYNIIWIIKDGIEFSYIYFENSAITTIHYDNDIKKLLINFGGVRKDQICGSIIKLSSIEIKEKANPLANLSYQNTSSSNIHDLVIYDEVNNTRK